MSFKVKQVLEDEHLAWCSNSSSIPPAHRSVLSSGQAPCRSPDVLPSHCLWGVSDMVSVASDKEQALLTQFPPCEQP